LSIKELANKNNDLLDELNRLNSTILRKDDTGQMAYHNFLNQKADLKLELHS